jgi:outer membrane protein
VQKKSSKRKTSSLEEVVGLAAQLPHYRASDEYTTYAFPLPYFVYRGEKIKANRDGIRGIFWRDDK